MAVHPGIATVRKEEAGTNVLKIRPLVDYGEDNESDYEPPEAVPQISADAMEVDDLPAVEDEEDSKDEDERMSVMSRAVGASTTASQAGDTETATHFRAVSESSDSSSDDSSDEDSSDDSPSEDSSSAEGSDDFEVSATSYQLHNTPTTLMQSDVDESDDDEETPPKKTLTCCSDILKDLLRPHPTVEVTVSTPIKYLGRVIQICQPFDKVAYVVLISGIPNLLGTLPQYDEGDTLPNDLLARKAVIGLDSVVCLENRTAVAYVSDIMCKTKRPIYVIAFKDKASMDPFNIELGLQIWYFPNHAKIQMPAIIRAQQGPSSDASGMKDKEQALQDFSDDEKEKFARSGGRRGYAGGTREAIAVEQGLSERPARRGGGNGRGGRGSRRGGGRGEGGGPVVPAGPPSFGGA